MENTATQTLLVLRQDRDRYILQADGRLLRAELSGLCRHAAADPLDLPTVGDWVQARETSGGVVLIDARLPRRNALLRKAPISGGRRLVGDRLEGGRTEAQAVAANIDAAFVVVGAGQDANPRRLERYLLMLRESAVPAVVLLNKCDLPGAEADAARLAAALPRAEGQTPPLLSVSALTGRGLAALDPWLAPGASVVFVGSSGAGKTSLLAALGAPAGRTGPLSEDNRKGRHTTTRRESFRLPGGCLVIDTPGIRELQLWCERGQVDALFGDIAAMACGCRFRDCRHAGEPGCALEAAVGRGELDPGRLESWRRLQAEAVRLAERQRQRERGRKPRYPGKDD